MATLLMPPDHHSSNKVLFPPLPFMGSAAVYAVDGSKLGAASIHHQQQQQHQQARRSKKGKNGQKKQPQRGMGVAELEKRRMEEEKNKEYMMASSFASSSFVAQPGVSSICFAPSHPLLHHQFQPFGPQRISMLKANAAEFVPVDQAENVKPQQQLVMMDGHSVLLSASSSSSRKQPADSGSCKSGLSDVHDYPTMALGFCSSPSPCSSHTIVSDKEHKSHSNNAASSSPSHQSSAAQFYLNNNKHGCFMGDSKAAALFLTSADPSNVHSNSSKRPRPSTPDSKRDDHRHRFLPHSQQQQQQMNSGGNKECSPFRLAPDVELFDPGFRTTARVHGDCRDWPGVFSVPAIKELSSFQIPGNTTNQALASANRTACDKKGPWPVVVQDRPNRCFEGTDSLDDHPSLGAHYTPGSIMNALNSSSSSPCFSPASSWQENQLKTRSEMGFSLDGQLRDSCSSSLNNNVSSKSRINHLEATSSKGDFLALRLASSASDHESEVSNNNKCYGMLKQKHEKVSDDGDSTQKLLSHQEASGETEDCNLASSTGTWPITKLHAVVAQPCMMNPRKIKSPLLLELSLKVPCDEGSSSSSLDLKLAL